MAEALPNDDELLIRYLDGEMNEGERAELERRLQQEPALKEKLQCLQMAVETIHQYGTASRVKAIHEQMMPELRPGSAKVVPMTRFIRYAMAVAASVILLFLVSRFLFNPKPSADRLYAEAFVPYDASAMRGSGPSTDIENWYRKNDFRAVTNYAAYPLRFTPRDSLLIGISYLQSDRADSAITWLLEPSRRFNNLRPDAQFYLSMAYLKAKKYAQALPLMKSIHSDAGHPYRVQFSEEYLSDLERVK